MPVYMKKTSVIKAHLGIEPNGKVNKFLVNTCAKHMDKYVPFDTGTLSKYKIEGNKIIYDQEYAEYQYYGMRADGTHRINEANRNRTEHPLASSYWDKKMATAEMPDVIREVQNYITKIGG